MGCPSPLHCMESLICKESRYKVFHLDWFGEDNDTTTCLPSDPPSPHSPSIAHVSLCISTQPAIVPLYSRTPKTHESSNNRLSPYRPIPTSTESNIHPPNKVQMKARTYNNKTDAIKTELNTWKTIRDAY